MNFIPVTPEILAAGREVNERVADLLQLTGKKDPRLADFAWAVREAWIRYNKVIEGIEKSLDQDFIIAKNFTPGKGEVH